MTIKEITLLSKKEYEKYKFLILRTNCYWWLRSPGKDQDCAAFVYGNYDVDLRGDYVDYVGNAVRPALLINLEISDSLFWYKPEKLIGTKIEYGKYQWTTLDAKPGEIYVLCDDIISRRRFDPESNDWDKSELKQWLETEGIKLIAK